MTLSDSRFLVMRPKSEVPEEKRVNLRELPHEELLHYHGTTAAADIMNRKGHTITEEAKDQVTAARKALDHECRRRMDPDFARQTEGESSKNMYGETALMWIERHELETELKQGPRPRPSAQSPSAPPSLGM